MIKYLPNRYKEEILKLYNYAFMNSIMFPEWKEVTTIFIDKSDRQKVRPITMSSCMLKVLERIINERLTWWIERKEILDEGQNGFRRGRSCQENLMALRIEAERGIFTRREQWLSSWISRRHMTT